MTTPTWNRPSSSCKNKGTLQYTNCWGVTAKGDNVGGAVDLVKYLTAT